MPITATESGAAGQGESLQAKLARRAATQREACVARRRSARLVYDAQCYGDQLQV